METKNKYTGKFVVVYDTVVDGEVCHTNEDETTKLFDSEDEAFKEIFDDATSMLSNYRQSELKVYCEGVTQKMVKDMKVLNNGTDIDAMRKFIRKNPQCNYNDEFAIPADEFILGRKAIFGSEGLQIIGTKLN